MTKFTRRRALQSMVSGAALLSSGKLWPLASVESTTAMELKGNIRHAVCRWCFNDLSVDALCRAAVSMGITAIDLVGPSDWPTLKKYGLFSSMCNGAEISLVDGWNNPKNHEELLKRYTAMIPKVGAAGYRNLICFSGNRNGMDDATGLAHCVEGLSKVLPLAQQHGVVLCMELFNSRIDHKDYQCDSSQWGIALCKALGSEHFKLLFDIYHMQINEGDIIRSIQDNHTYFAHYHTAGVPGRNEIDDTQEIYYPAVMRAIVDTGFKGFVAQEFIPKSKDKLGSLQQAIQICDV